MKRESISVPELPKQVVDALERIATSGERIVLKRRGKSLAAIVPMKDLELLLRVENAYWTKEALRAEAEMKRRGEKPIPFEQVEREIEAKRARRRRGKNT